MDNNTDYKLKNERIANQKITLLGFVQKLYYTSKYFPANIVLKNVALPIKKKIVDLGTTILIII